MKKQSVEKSSAPTKVTKTSNDNISATPLSTFQDFWKRADDLNKTAVDYGIAKEYYSKQCKTSYLNVDISYETLH